MNEELAVVLGLVLAVIAIVLAYSFMASGTESTIGSMDFVSEHTNRDIQNRYHEGTAQGIKEVRSWVEKDSPYLQV